MNTIHYYPVPSEKNKPSPCPNCPMLRDADCDSDGESYAVFHECVAFPSEEGHLNLCYQNAKINALAVQMESEKEHLDQLVRENKEAQEYSDNEGDDGQPDEAKEWEDFGEVYSDGDDF